MSEDRWQRVKRIFGAVLDRPAEAREAFLRAACGGDDGLRREVESLLAARVEAGDFLSEPARAEDPELPTARVAGHSREEVTTARLAIGTRLGPYEVVSFLGAGGMGEVYKARDARLGREVAIKVLPEQFSGDRERLRRFEQESRAAGALNHPNLLVVHDIGVEGGMPYLVSEYLEGETLAEGLRAGALSVRKAVDHGIQIARGLAAAHERGVVHRDIKPANVLVTCEGLVKILDFGLAKLVRTSPHLGAHANEGTASGAVLGTASYMSPEQVRGQAVDHRADIFSLGVVLYQMLSGRRPFDAETAVETMSAILKEDPKPLRSPDREMPSGVERVVLRCLEKQPEARFQSARDLVFALEAALQGLPTSATGGVSRAVAMTRLIVLPFRVLRPDAEIDFLAFSLPDAITASLSGLDALVVRSSLAAARFAGESLDLKKIATEADVDVVLTGMFLRAGQELRVSAQLVEAPSGTLIWSQTSQATLRDIFQLQDGIVRRIVEALSLPLTAREHRFLGHDVPSSATAYEFYLRGNQLIQQVGLGTSERFALARDLYLRCLEDDPRYAPAWARLGRCYRLLSKAGEDPNENMAKAESSLKRALELNSNLAFTHKLYAQLETDLGHPADAMSRLIHHAHPESADPELFAGLVHACRYCGLLEASVAAHERARRLDPKVPTGIRHTYWLLGEYERALEERVTPPFYLEALVLVSMRREGEALSILHERALEQQPEAMRAFLTSLRALLEGKEAESLEATEKALAHIHDPEAQYYLARQLAHLGARKRALEEMRKVVEQGFYCPQAFVRDSWLDSIRSNPEFARTVEDAECRRRGAARAFIDAGGGRLLGVHPA